MVQHAAASTSTPRAGMSPGDFMFGMVLGQGSFAKVYHAQFKRTSANFAIKVMDQEFIKRHKKVPFVVMERQVMSKLAHPNIVKFYCSFKDDDSLYMVMELCRGGELLHFICKERDQYRKQGIQDQACSASVTQFYMAQLVCALEYMHSNNVIHRDLKPDNILLTEQGQLKVTDFGTATTGDNQDENNNFCGTAEYLSPEVLNDLPACVGSDLWALGCIIFQMFAGRPPFRGENDYFTFQDILTHDSDTMEFPATFPEPARDLVRKLLVRDLSMRLTEYATIKAHPFFDGIEWEAVATTRSPVTPDVATLPTPTIDGAAPNWSIAGAFTDMASPFAESDFPLPVATRSSNHNSSLRNSATTAHSGLLDNNESVLFQSEVKLHAAMFMKKPRDLLFTSKGRLILIDAKTNTHDIFHWDVRYMRVVPKGDSTFEIRTTSSSFKITDPTHGSHHWVQVLTGFTKR
ncbi:AGC/PDK1 protein kinase [Saprolegnia diclina VS20]|uniref:non-specific serine/threonine protein kinase n=1 Tax=Saprolegnia diclina (strain VS20) TaxID=1156394 RepID=T0S6C7_SAPDV|nr:AGC/PDK1 protein kinase [Saprolegnia diclina VS20]EQC40693.1 AGC/PDK1 protein kinase [Saprolegnia diclina VS20]|eukprot:XP_008605537.1 AGC/PDK1 protein kinase [Saprolegnia diclina VS20]